MANNLPDEIVSEILSPALRVPEAMFSDMSLISPFAAYSRVSSSAALLVSKAWLRVATPLLYNVVVLRSKAQVRALYASLIRTPELGRFIKKLRVEGGFGPFMRDILKSTPNISDLFLSLQLHSSDSSTGLASGLSFINPSRVIIFDDGNRLLGNKAVMQLIEALEEIGKNWTNLKTIHFPYTRPNAERRPFFVALCSSPTLRVVSFPFQVPFLSDVLPISALSTLEAIEIRRPRTGEMKVKLLDSGDPRIARLLRWAEPATESAICRSRPTIHPPTDPHFRPLEGIPQAVADLIWSRVLFFAMLSPVPPTNDEYLEQKTNARRLLYLLVSKTFHRLGIHYLYRCPNIKARTAVSRFMQAVVKQPARGADVQQLEFRAQPPFMLTPFLSLTRNLTHLVGSNGILLPWPAFAALAETAGGTLEEFSGFTITSQSTTAHSPAVFRHFRVLRSLTWSCGQQLVPGAFFAPEAIEPGSLPALEFLTPRSPEVLDVFARMTLPNLRRLVLNLKDSQADTFLRAHGPKIWHLHMHEVAQDTESVFALCPNVSILRYTLSYSNHYNVALGAASEHAFLTKLVLSKYVNSTRTQEEREWRRVAAALDCAQLPALREIHVRSCEWPTTEHGIAKSVWVEWAESLLSKGIKLTDNRGAEWRPRLKVPRR